MSDSIKTLSEFQERLKQICIEQRKFLGFTQSEVCQQLEKKIRHIQEFLKN